MRRILLASIILASTLLSAQTKPVTNIQVDRNMANRSTIQVDPIVTLRAQIAQLQKQVKELKSQLDQVMQDSAAARRNIPKCSADLQESASANGSRQCSPYVCDGVVGTCLAQCVTSNDCGSGFACDTGAQHCISTR